MPADCAPGGFRDWLLLSSLSPLVLILLSIFAGIVHRAIQNGWTFEALRLGLLNALPLALVCSFMFAPAVSASIFRSWLCISYSVSPDGSNTRSFLRADLS
eukprot:511498-Prymnesium_polylepis.1